jgi:hypothetical protein
MCRDVCSICSGNRACVGCDNVAFSGLEFDGCGECAGNNKTCAGCDNVLYSNKTFDSCGVCGGDCAASDSKKRTRTIIIAAAAGGGGALIIAAIIIFIVLKQKKISSESNDIALNDRIYAPIVATGTAYGQLNSTTTARKAASVHFH